MTEKPNLVLVAILSLGQVSNDGIVGTSKEWTEDQGKLLLDNKCRIEQIL